MIQPLPWQPEAIDMQRAAFARKISFLDGSDTGTGKTYTACFAAAADRAPLGVACPISVIPSWIEAAEKTGATLAFIGNIEALKRKGSFLRRVAAHRWAWNLPANCRLIFDEVQRYKSYATQNGKTLLAAPRPVLMLSATPFGNPIEFRGIGHQLGLLDWNDFDSWLGRNGCVRGQMGGYEFVGISRVPPGSPPPSPAMLAAAKAEILDRIHRQIFHTGRGIRIRKADLGDLFPRIRRETRIVPVDNPEAIDAAYAEELELLLRSAVSGGVEFLRARQMTEFSMVPSIIEMIHDLHNAGHAVLVFVNFRDTFRRILEEFPDAARIFGGQEEEGVPREGERKRFAEDRTRTMLLMLGAGGDGLSAHDLRGEFPRASIIVPGVSAQGVIQADGRDHRGGGLSPVDHYYLYGDTAMERMRRKKLEAKIGDIGMIVDGDLMP